MRILFEHPIYIVIIYLLIINTVAFITSAYDKHVSRLNGRVRRISEKTLILMAVLGGSIGLYVSMYTLRHKTKHIKFTLGVPLIIILQLAAVVFVYIFFIN